MKPEKAYAFFVYIPLYTATLHHKVKDRHTSCLSEAFREELMEMQIVFNSFHPENHFTTVLVSKTHC